MLHEKVKLPPLTSQVHEASIYEFVNKSWKYVQKRKKIRSFLILQVLYMEERIVGGTKKNIIVLDSVKVCLNIGALNMLYTNLTHKI